MLNVEQAPLQLWGGIECTVNRVDDSYFDQIEKSGHDKRLDDLSRFAELGCKSLRIPVLWERNWRAGDFADSQSYDWTWSDQCLMRLRELQINPIVGLVHHGSGPKTTNLLEPNFATQLSAYATCVATRYPWVRDYTPVNEPLTTARFSALYGLWYPHHTDVVSFFSAVVVQCEGIAAAMLAIRKINSQARLIQTEDLGEVASTPLLSYQAAFENTRRWLSLDILYGRFNAQHPLWDFFSSSGVSNALLERASKVYCPPDIIGINHYITSNRFLDERLELYPTVLHGGNGRHRYVDVETVRVKASFSVDIGELLRKVWQRYGQTLAVTEVHIGCGREDQLRWFMDIWNACLRLQTESIPVKAVTAWSLLGSYDWDSLVTKPQNHYEAGVFDLRSPTPRPTAMVNMLRSVSSIGTFDHPVLDVPGWWHRDDRLLYPPCTFGNLAMDYAEQDRGVAIRPVRRILITGARGTLANAFAFVCEKRGLPYVALSRAECNIVDYASVVQAVDAIKPWAIINAAGFCDVDRAEAEPQQCHLENKVGAANLAEVSAERGIHYVTFSSDLVFDGQQSRPYTEALQPNPLNVYGRSKWDAERAVLDIYPQAMVVRTSAFFGPWDEYNFLIKMLRLTRRGESVHVADDLVISPTYVPDLVQQCLDLMIDGERGIVHLSNRGFCSWFDFATMALTHFSATPSSLEPRPAHALGFRAQRPVYSALASERSFLMPDIDHAIGRFARECRVAW